MSVLTLIEVQTCVCVCVRMCEPTLLCLSAAELESTRQQDAQHLLHLPQKDGHPHSKSQGGDALSKHYHYIYEKKRVLLSSKIGIARFHLER